MLRTQKCGYLFRSVVVLFFIISYSASEPITNSTTTLAPVSPCVVENNTAACSAIENFDSLTDVRISKLIVNSQNLKRIEKNDLAKFVDLKTIDISDSGLIEIDPEAFATLANLEEMNLSGNTELKIPEVFIRSKSLTHLNLSEVPITKFTEKTFIEVPNLKVLDLTATNIQDLAPLSNLEALTTLLVSKDDSYSTTTICDHKSLKNVFIRTENGQEEEILCEVKKDAKIEETKQDKKSEEVTTINSEVLSKSEANTTKAAALEVTSESSKVEIDNKTNEVVLTTKETAKKQDDAVTDTTTPTPQHQHHEEAIEEHNITKKIDESTTEKSVAAVKKIEVQAPEVVSSEETKLDKDNETMTDVVMNQENNDTNNYSVEDLGNKDLPSTIGKADSNGTNIVLGIVLCVMIVGALGFGYRYYKNRRSGYRHANTSENVEEGKELQTIVAHHVDPEQN